MQLENHSRIIEFTNIQSSQELIHSVFLEDLYGNP